MFFKVVGSRLVDDLAWGLMFAQFIHSSKRIASHV